jgi:hypothetical protein
MVSRVGNPVRKRHADNPRIRDLDRVLETPFFPPPDISLTDGSLPSLATGGQPLVAASWQIVVAADKPAGGREATKVLPRAGDRRHEQ